MIAHAAIELAILRRSLFLNREEPRQRHRYFDCRRKCSLSFSPYPVPLA
jgi:hypothetical protein